MGYRNQPIIQDMDGMEGWASFAEGVKDVVVGGLKDNAKFIKEQNKISDAKQDRFDLAFNKSSLTQYSTLKDTTKAMKAAGNSDSIIKDYQAEQERLMKGYTNDEGEYIEGSIKAAAILETRGVSDEEREALNKSIYEADSNLDTILKEAGVLLTDIDVIKTKAAAMPGGPGFDMHWAGDGFNAQQNTQFAGMALAGLSIPGVTLDMKKIVRKKMPNGKHANVLTVKNTLKKTDPLLKGMDLEKNKYLTDNGDNTVTYTFEQDMTDWDGNMLTETDAATDTQKILKEAQLVTENGINENLKVQFVSERIEGGDFDQQETSTFIDTKKINSGYGSMLTDRVANISNLPVGRLKAYLDQRMGMSVDIKKFALLEPGKKLEKIKQMEMNYMQRQNGLSVGKSLNPGFNMEERELSSQDIRFLKSKGITGYSAGEMGMFEIDEKSISRTKAKQDESANQDYFKTQKGYFKQANPTDGGDEVKEVYGRKSAGAAQSDMRIMWKPDNMWYLQRRTSVNRNGVQQFMYIDVVDAPGSKKKSTFASSLGY